jgi:hypothetical protein
LAFSLCTETNSLAVARKEDRKELTMTPSVQSLAAVALAIFVVLMLIVLARFLIRRTGRGALAGLSAAAGDGSGIVLEERLAPLTSGEARHASIVEQMDSIERFTKRRMSEVMTAMVDSTEWQALAKQIDELSEERVAHLRILANRAAALPPAEALRQTLKVYSLTDLMLAIDHQLVDQSDVVSHVLNDWFHSHRGVSLAEFEARLHQDAARTLLLDLDYAHPPADALLTQLKLAEEHCHAAWLPGESETAPSHLLCSEIALRRRRLQPGS